MADLKVGDRVRCLDGRRGTVVRVGGSSRGYWEKVDHQLYTVNYDQPRHVTCGHSYIGIVARREEFMLLEEEDGFKEERDLNTILHGRTE